MSHFQLPLKPKVFSVTAYKDFSLNAGCYALIGATGSGKTLLSIAFAHFLKAGQIPTFYFYINEPRSTPNMTEDFASLYTPAGLVNCATLNTYLAQNSSKDSVLIFDSANHFFAEKGAEKGQAIGRGMNYHIQDFLRHTQSIAFSNNSAVILVINNELIRAADVFEGLCEGTITFRGRELFITDRSNRNGYYFKLPLPNLNEALDVLGYTKPYNDPTLPKTGERPTFYFPDDN